MKRIKILGTLLNANQWGRKTFILQCHGTDTVRITAIDTKENYARIHFRIFSHDESYSDLSVSCTYRDYDSEGYECGPEYTLVPDVQKPGYGIIDFSFGANIIDLVEIKDTEESK